MDTEAPPLAAGRGARALVPLLRQYPGGIPLIVVLGVLTSLSAAVRLLTRRVRRLGDDADRPDARQVLLRLPRIDARLALSLAAHGDTPRTGAGRG